MHKLSNDALAENIRAANRRRSERQRARRVSAGKAAFTVWIPTNLQKQIVELATAKQATTSDIAEQVLTAGLSALTAPTLPVVNNIIASPQTAPESLPPFVPVTTERETDSTSVVTQSAPGTLAERDALIVRLHGEGFNKTLIGARLFDLGWRTANNNQLSRDTIGKAIKRAGLTEQEGAP